MSFDDLRDRRWAWVVEIAGLTERYYSTHAPGATLHGGLVQPGGGIPYTDVKAVLDVGARNDTLDETGGLAIQAPVRVRLKAVDAYTSNGVRVQPCDTLMRTTHRGADRRTKLLTGLRHTLAGATVEVENDVSAWPTPGLLHIGQEAIYYTGTAGDGTVGNRYRFTGCQRSAALTQVQGHPVDPDRGMQEWVTSDVVHWRARRARIYVSEIYADGSHGDWLEYWRGLLDQIPTMAKDEIVIMIAPMTAALGWQLSLGAASARSRVVPNWHALTRGYASDLLAEVVWRRRTLFESAASNADLVGNTIDCQGYARLSTLFDPTLPEGNPRHGQFRIGTPNGANDSAADVAIAISNPADDIARIEFPDSTLPQIVDRDWNNVAQVISDHLMESFPLALIDADPGTMQLVRWPTVLTDAINRSEAWRAARGSVDSWMNAGSAGGEPRWTRLGLVQRDGGWYLRARKVSSSDGDGAVYLEFRGGDKCTAGFGWWPAGREADLRAEQGTSGQFRTGLVLEVSANPDDAFSEVQIVGPPAWWYAPGEPYIGPVEDDLYSAAGVAQTLRFSGAGTSVDVPVTGVQAVNDPNGDRVGYVYTVADSHRERLQAIAMMQTDPVFEVAALARAERVSAPEFALRLLQSGEGRLTNGDYDVLPYGLNFAEGELDVQSFTAMAVPDVLADATWEIDPGKPVADQLRGILIGCRCQIAQVFDGSIWVLRCVPLRAASAMNSSITITDADTLSPVETVRDGRVVRSYSVEVNHPRPGEQGEPMKIQWVDTAARNAAGGAMGETLTLELRGVRLDGTAGDMIQDLLPLITGIRADLGVERVRWRVRLYIDHVNGMTRAIGDTATLTSSFARDLKPSDPVVDRPCLILAVKVDPKAGFIELEMVGRHGQAAGWVPAMRVDSVTDATTVVVEAAAYSQSDASYFQVGDKVCCIPAGDWASRASRTITGKAGTSVTFNAAHGLVSGDTIRLDDYVTAGAARPAVRGYAYIGDDAETLGAGDPAKIIG